MTMNIEATELFKQMSDATRLRCLLLLQSEGELCVCELIHAIGESQPKISRHLAHLRKSELVVDRKESQRGLVGALSFKPCVAGLGKCRVSRNISRGFYAATLWF